MSKGILANFCQKKAGLGRHSYLKYALEQWKTVTKSSETYFIISLFSYVYSVLELEVVLRSERSIKVENYFKL